MWTKICANTNLADAQLAAELGADAVGFVFAPSKRQVTPEEVAAITPHLPGSVEKIGVFSPGDDDTLDQAIAISGLTALQLHGSFSEWEMDGLLDKTEGKLDLIQVVGFETEADDPAAALARFEEQLAQAAANPALSAILLDTARSGASGGLGVAFDWTLAAEIVRRIFGGVRKSSDKSFPALGILQTRVRESGPGAPVRTMPNLIIAGGLNAENVRLAIDAFHPYGVDVASGVEKLNEPGKKDPARLRAFLSAARGSAHPNDQVWR
jgi:phosphoribosylanthranilate isomerase